MSGLSSSLLLASSGSSSPGEGTSAHMVQHMSSTSHPPINLHTLLTDWQSGPFPIAVALSLILIGLWYLGAVCRLKARGRRWSPARTVAFFAGLLAVEVALGSSVASMTMWSFSAHVMQHLLLMIIAPPLAAMGAPMTLILQTSSRSTKTRWLHALHSRPFAVLRHPVVVFFLYYLSMYAFFLTGAIGFAMTHMWVMDLINLGFLGGATLFWWPMVGIDPIPGETVSPGLKLLNLLIGVPIEAFLGIALMQQSTPVAPMYTHASTHMGGGILWMAGEAATVIALLPIYVQWVRSDAVRARRVDARIAAGTLERPDFEGKNMVGTLRALRRDN